MFNPVLAAKSIKEEYMGYISTFFHIEDKDYASQLISELKKDNIIAKGPYIDISSSFKTGRSLLELIEEGEVSGLFKNLEGDIGDVEKEIPLSRTLYLHQEKAIIKTNENKNLIVTTGTGSGKTECFVLPIINYLLKEKENGTLSSGVRVIVIYPMNALANDQMKRLRKLLKNYPDITFGVYNSSTKQNEESARKEYRKIFKDENGHPLEPLKNEIISRDEMQINPPNILITNYAMLEYMMLRPKDDLVFSNAQLHFLVLDEAHIYRGTTGMETALLLQRLKARLNKPKDIIHILTSATLGDRKFDDSIIDFAETLCNSKFYKDNIIRSEVVEEVYNYPSSDIPMKLFGELANPEKSLDEIAGQYGFQLDKYKTDAEFLYDLCKSSDVYRSLRGLVTEPMLITDITNKLKDKYSFINSDDIINIITIASQASKNKTALLKARYHMFIKALDGAYVTIGDNKRLLLTRKQSEKVGDDCYKLFECAVCDDCGKIAVVGKVVDGFLVSGNKLQEDDIEYYSIDKQDYDSNDTEISKDAYVICAKCGAVVHASIKNNIKCNCGSQYYVRVLKAKKTDSGKAKCPHCSFGEFKTFYTGSNAATAVLGTSLFEKLPENEVLLKRRKINSVIKRGLFGGGQQKQEVESVKKAKQFLTFSDSRGDAAFFASYMTASYKEFLRRRGIWHVIEENKESISSNPWEIKDFVDRLTAYFDKNRTFAEPGSPDSENLSPKSEKNAWLAVLNEMVNARRTTSLTSLGILKFEFKGNSEDVMDTVANEYKKSPVDMKALFDLLVMDIVYHGALEGECNLTDDEREYIYYTAIRKRVKKAKDSISDKKKTNILSWLPSMKTNGGYRENGRLGRLKKALNISNDETVVEVLNEYWDYISNEGYLLDDDGLMYLKTDSFTITAGKSVYKCNTCGKTTMFNCGDMCSNIRCNGKIALIDNDILLKNNHYVDLYRSPLMKPLHIKEHTAQLGRDEQQKYQEMFINKEINALSCSTTFEMGVDVGDLETVFLRNMPPSPANYVQRAGRAGRSRNSAAFSLTFAKLGSHDFTFFKNPESMIRGQIGVPAFKIKNEKVVLRHIFAVALSKFFSQHEEIYNKNNSDIFLNKDGWQSLYSWLRGRPSDLKDVLQQSIPADMHQVMGIDDYSWIAKLIGINGCLNVAIENYRQTISYYETEIKEGNTNGWSTQRRLVAYKNSKKDLIEFLVRNNILPKYGFPVDTVELYTNASATKEKKHLQIVRDLQLAISEYAPDSQIVADGKLYTSRYIRKLPHVTGKDWDIVYIAQCAICKTWNYRSFKVENDNEMCVSCGNKIKEVQWRASIEPRNGFIADGQEKEVAMHKPKKLYHSEDFYIGDAQRKVINRYFFALTNIQDRKVKIETSINDSLMVVCNEDFYVCEKCGYAESTRSNRNDKKFNSHQYEINKVHKNHFGKKCEGILKKYKLSHVFKTDVVRIDFLLSDAQQLDVMLSVMYALLEGISAELEIERSDIKGCLHRIVNNKRMMYSIILYDAVPGGAGHVRRIVTSNGKIFQNVIQKAIEITRGCNCNPSCYSCLRNYYNQKIHDNLNREKAYKFLEKYCGTFIAINEKP